MRIALLTQHARPWGGVESHVRDLAWGLRSRGHSLILAHESRGKDPAYCDPFDRVLDLSGLGLSESMARLLAAEPDVVYVHKSESPELVEALSLRLPVTIMVHDHDLTCPRRHRYTLLGRRRCERPMGWRCLGCAPTLERRPGTRRIGWRAWGPRMTWLRLLRRLPRVVVASQAMRETLTLNGVKASRVDVVAPVPAAEPPASPPAYPARPHLLFAGQIIRTKGWDLLLDAYERLEDPPSLTFAGGGSELALLQKRIARSRFAGRIQSPGWLDRARLAEEYARASLVVVPSRWQEPFGLIGLEAMAWARPVVAFDVGGISSWLRHGRTGLLVPPEDPAALAAALDALLASPERARVMGLNGHTDRHQRFDHGAFLDRIESLLFEHVTAGVS